MGLQSANDGAAAAVTGFVPLPATPRVLWVELTSKCPLDCVFCSRKLRRGAGRHLPWEVFRALVASLEDVRTVVLNYSGESTCYPELAQAISFARGRGAWVELVSALGAATAETARALALSGLGRLSVSVHAVGEACYREVYRRGCAADLLARLREFREASRGAAVPPVLDFCLVAMERNLDQIRPVAALAAESGVADLLVFPVLRRDEVAERFEREVDAAGAHRPEFRRRVAEAVARAREAYPGVRIAVGNPGFEDGAASPGEVPGPWPGELPAGARIHTCEQNPWETAHVLSNGDVVPCEVLDRMAMGNLRERGIAEIWRSGVYGEFRQRYGAGEVPECRVCAWKRAYVPAAPAAEILGARGRSAQLLWGWHEPAGEEWVWSTQRAAAVLRARAGSRVLHVCGVLPPGVGGEANRLAIRCNGVEVGEVVNPWEEVMPFGLDFAAPRGPRWVLEFRTRHVFRGCERGTGSDVRDLGFALILAASKAPRPERGAGQERAAEAMARWTVRADRVGATLRRMGVRLRPVRGAAPEGGISVVIPERDNAEELAECLESVARAAGRAGVPVEVVVSASGAEPDRYGELRRRHAGVRWLFSRRPLPFHAAVMRAVRAARFPWVYLLNNDAAVEADALREVAAVRAADVFAVGSQILFKDRTRFREETNWGAFAVVDGLAEIADRIPEGEGVAPGGVAPGGVAECFYVGGGASLFQRAALLRVARGSGAYAPFYWEDVEWGWRARKLGMRVLFCPGSVARHRHRATIARLYGPEEIERVLARNRVLFQLRNMTEAGSREGVRAEMARVGEAGYFARWRVMWGVVWGRIWNWVAPVEDEKSCGVRRTGHGSEA